MNSAPLSPAPMNVVIDQSQFKLRDTSLAYIERRLRKLDAWTKKFPSRACHITQERCSREGTHRFVVSLKLPHVTLVGHAEESHLRPAFDRAFKKVLRQLNEFKHLLRREHLQRRNSELRDAAAAHLDEVAQQISRDHELDLFKERLGEHVETLRSFVAADVAEIRRTRPDFSPSRNDLVEAALLEALERFPEKPDSIDLKSWLYEIALQVVDRRAHEVRIPSQSMVPREVPTGIPQDRPSAWELFSGLEQAYGTNGAERSVDDPLDALGSSPDPLQFLEREELRGLVDAKLTELPRDWRRSFRLHYLEGFRVPEIGRMLELSDEQVGFRLRGAAEFLRDHLEELRDSV